MKIYVASSWRNAQQPAVVSALREAGHEVYDFRNPPNGSGGFRWTDVDPEWKGWSPARYREALQHPVAEEGFRCDLDGMIWADACVLVMPCGRSAHLEAGWMAGAGKLTLVLLTEAEPELMYRLLGKLCLSMDEVLTELAKHSAPVFDVPRGCHALWSAIDEVRSRDARWLGPKLRELHSRLGGLLQRVECVPTAKRQEGGEV